MNSIRRRPCADPGQKQVPGEWMTQKGIDSSRPVTEAEIQGRLCARRSNDRVSPRRPRFEIGCSRQPERNGHRHGYRQAPALRVQRVARMSEATCGDESAQGPGWRFAYPGYACRYWRITDSHRTCRVRRVARALDSSLEWSFSSAKQTSFDADGPAIEYEPSPHRQQKLANAGNEHRCENIDLKRR